MNPAACFSRKSQSPLVALAARSFCFLPFESLDSVSRGNSDASRLLPLAFPHACLRCTRVSDKWIFFNMRGIALKGPGVAREERGSRGFEDEWRPQTNSSPDNQGVCSVLLSPEHARGGAHTYVPPTLNEEKRCLGIGGGARRRVLPLRAPIHLDATVQLKFSDIRVSLASIHEWQSLCGIVE